MEAQGYPMQLIKEDETFDAAGLEAFIRASKELSDCGVAYNVISIMGPQSSGKSYLLNSIFKTNFTVMDATKGRSQTTKGIWIGKCIKPCSIVVDLEGSDGSARGTEDTSFERRSALFALTVSDIVAVNMWHSDLGRVNAGGVPLLSIVFQERSRLPPRKTTLLVVLRDYNKETPLDVTEIQVKSSMQQIWNSIAKHADHETDARLSNYFQVEVVALPNKDRKEEFEEEVVKLRQRFSRVLSPSPGEHHGDAPGAIPISGLSMSLEGIWDMIRNNKHLDFPAFWILVSNAKCEEIAEGKFSSFRGKEDYKSFLHALGGGPDPEFREKMESFLGSCLDEYDKETAHYVKEASAAKRQLLKSKILEYMQPAFEKMVEHLRAEVVSSYVEKTRDLENGGKNVQDVLNTFARKCEELTVKEAKWSYEDAKTKLVEDILGHMNALLEAQSSSDKTLATVLQVLEIVGIFAGAATGAGGVTAGGLKFLGRYKGILKAMLKAVTA